MKMYDEHNIYFAFIYKKFYFLTFKDLVVIDNFKHFNIKPFSINYNEVFFGKIADAIDNNYLNLYKELTYDQLLEQYSSNHVLENSLEKYLRKIDNELL